MALTRRRATVGLVAAAMMTILPVTSPARATDVNPLRNLPGCQNVPDVSDSEGNSANFCDDPRGWIQLVVGELRTFCGGRCHPVFLVCALTGGENCES